MRERSVTPTDMERLRSAGLIYENEVAVVIGDRIIAENILDKTRRVVETGGLILESNKRLLRD